ncbi:glycosyl transferase group 1 [Candidatus Moduliflexus flocculans]|uniref:Glycosyl transferase group 1 n=1 Tax=Candidatus Moduliflexus flocculans TaxID=1499966 RepID=A0A081BQS3_9BACT|nr:glycosyl transferase group 1 [Candidatus Moduliflexus flocculans]
MGKNWGTFCLITGIFPPDIGGPATYVSRFASSLHEQGYEVHVVTLGDEAQSLPFSVYRIARALPLPIRLLLLFATLLRVGWKADVWYINGLEVPAVLAGLLLRKRLVMKIVGDYAWERAMNLGLTTDSIDGFQHTRQCRQVEWHKWLRGWYTRRVSTVITPSRYLKSLVQGWGVPENRVQVIYNAVEELPPNLLSRQEIRQRFGFSEDDKFVITVGRLVKWKGIAQLIEVVASLDESVKLLILGDGPEKNMLTELATQRDVAGRIIFGGKAERSFTLSAIRAADVFVLNTGYEGFSHVLLEAMQVGTPIITTNVCGNPELVAHNQNGILIPVGDIEALHSALQRIFSQPSSCQALISGGRESIERLTWERLLAQTLPILTY